MNQQSRRPSQQPSHRPSQLVGSPESTTETGFDPMAFWLLLLFVATFFGIAAERAHHPSLFSSPTETTASIGLEASATTIAGLPVIAQNREQAARRFDLSSAQSANPQIENQIGNHKPVIPALGK